MEIESDSKKDTKIVLEKNRETGSFLLPKIRKEGDEWLDGSRESPFKCVGKNPKLSQAKSKNDKNISGLLAQIEAGKIGIHTFTNASAFTVADVDTKIISIEFATTEANHAQFFGQVIVDVMAQPVTRSSTASGDVVIPSVNVDGVPVNPEEPVVIGNTEEQTITVSLPIIWQEDGHEYALFVENDYAMKHISNKE